MKKPVIGVTPQLDVESGRIGIGPNFFQAVSAAGGLPLLLPLYSSPADIAEILNHFDGFLYSGGPDINPLLFGEEAEPECGAILPERDKLELALLPEICKTGKPVLGICRGIQVMNVVLGGTLIQDIPSVENVSSVEGTPALERIPFVENVPSKEGTPALERIPSVENVPSKEGTPALERIPSVEYIPFVNGSRRRIGHYQKAGNEVCTHLVHVKKDTLLYDIVKKDILTVNSFHHQACKKLGEGIVLEACASDGIIEAISLKGHPFFLGVQWHPEHLFQIDEDTMKIWQAFINACQ